MSAVLKAREPSARYLTDLEPPLFRQQELLVAAPSGVARLRELIVILAVRGRLVPQWSGELVPASVESKCEFGPFDLPEGWVWVTLGALQPSFQNGASSRGDPGGHPITVLRLADIKDRRVSLADTREVPIRREDIEKFGLRDGDILITRVNGSADIVGQFNLVEGEPHAIYCDHFIRMRVSRDVLHPKYLALFGGSDVVRSRVSDLFVSSAGQKTVNQGHIASLPIAIPPLAEQARIVARVDELMRLCDALEEKGRLEAEQHARLLSTLLGTLTDSATPEELATNWQRVAEHFDLLLDRPEAVDAFEQAVVQLAVRGVLTNQAVTEEPAAAFVSRLNAGRTARRASTTVKPLASVDQEGLPAGWCLTNVGSVADCLDYLRRPVKKAEREGHTGNVPYYGANGQVGWIGKHLFDEDLVLVVEDETFIGRTKPFSYVVRGKSWVNNHAHVLRPLGGMSAEYLDLCLQRYDFIPLTSGTTNRRKLTQPGLLNAEFMLAPLAEQARIVARVEELRRLCAALRQRLAASQTTQSHLADALVAEVT